MTCICTALCAVCLVPAACFALSAFRAILYGIHGFGHIQIRFTLFLYQTLLLKQGLDKPPLSGSELEGLVLLNKVEKGSGGNPYSYRLTPTSAAELTTTIVLAQCSAVCVRRPWTGCGASREPSQATSKPTATSQK